VRVTTAFVASQQLCTGPNVQYTELNGRGVDHSKPASGEMLEDPTYTLLHSPTRPPALALAPEGEGQSQSGWPAAW
jgi:hypothetical protein